MGYCPFESRYNELYRDTGMGRLGWACRRGHDTAEHASGTALRYGQEGPRYGRPARRGVQQRAAKLERESRYKNCIVAGGGFCVAIWLRYRLRYDAQRPATRCRSTATHAATRQTRHAAGACVAIPILYRGREGACDTHSLRARHGREGSHDTAPNARCARSLGSGFTPYAPNPVLTQCTVLSHCLEHCS